MNADQQFVVAVIAQLAVLLVAIAGVVSSFRNGKQLDTLKSDVNGRVTQLIETSTEAAHDAGKLSARLQEDIRTAKVAQTLAAAPRSLVRRQRTLRRRRRE